MRKMKVFSSILLLLTMAMLCAEDAGQTLMERAVGHFYAEMREKVPSGDAISIAQADGSAQQRFNRMLARRITDDGVYRLIERENLPTLFQENLSQQDRVFDNENAPQIGVFTPAEWLILGSVEQSSTSRWLKKRYQIKVNVSIDRLETGEVLHNSHFGLYFDEQPPVWLFLVNLGVTLLLLIVVNRLTHGYYAGWLAGAFLVENALVVIWQFFL